MKSWREVKATLWRLRFAYRLRHLKLQKLRIHSLFMVSCSALKAEEDLLWISERAVNACREVLLCVRVDREAANRQIPLGGRVRRGDLRLRR